MTPMNQGDPESNFPASMGKPALQAPGIIGNFLFAKEQSFGRPDKS